MLEMPHVLLQILGRAENVIGFIRRGESEAWTEIHLSGGSGQRDVVILRKMKVAEKVRADGTEYQGVDSTWRINGVPFLLPKMHAKSSLLVSIRALALIHAEHWKGEEGAMASAGGGVCCRGHLYRFCRGTPRQRHAEVPETLTKCWLSSWRPTGAGGAFHP